MDDTRDPYLEQIIRLLRDARIEMGEAVTMPLNIDACDCKTIPPPEEKNEEG